MENYPHSHNISINILPLFYVCEDSVSFYRGEIVFSLCNLVSLMF